uniref:Uncharacterized protein n=1 Tax=Arundo donax TaxID=35708 RepID=A0A0A9FCL3_ARUDO
MYVLLQPMEE